MQAKKINHTEMFYYYSKKWLRNFFQRVIDKKNNSRLRDRSHVMSSKIIRSTICKICINYIRSLGINEVKKLFDANNSSYVQSQSHRIIKNRNWLIIAVNESEVSEHILIEKEDTKINFQRGVLHFELLSTVNYKLLPGNSYAQLDAKNIEFPLMLRKWKQGDYFYPLGMHKKKKLSRFFIDEKLSATAKKN